MAFVAGFNSRLVVGPLAWSVFMRGLTTDDQTDMLDVTVCDGTNAKAFIPGQTTSTMNFDCLLDGSGAAGSEFINSDTWASTPQPVTIAPNLLTAGQPVILASAVEASATITSTTSEAVALSVATQTDGATDYGVSLEDFTAITSDTNGTARDNGAATANGGIAQIHVSAFSGLTSDVVTIEHSVDGSTSWATLATFATVTGTTSERVVVSPGTTVRRYLRVVDDVTGTGSCTRQVSFARR